VNDEPSAITVAMSPEQAYELLQELAENDEVRAAVAADPRTELGNRGIVIPPELLPREAKLASKEDFAELLFLLGDDPQDIFGRPKGEAWLFHLLCFIGKFGALPFPQRDGAR
jgi:hypothetical protein